MSGSVADFGSHVFLPPGFPPSLLPLDDLGENGKEDGVVQVTIQQSNGNILEVAFLPRCV